MKTTIVSLVIGLLMIHTLSGQVKIGDNPQNLDPASVLELESTSKALVIPRLTDAQMNAITPLRGALVYNTDQDCIHYFDGSQWINICEALDNSFTVSTRADFLSQINPNARDSTVVITPTLNPDGSTNYNFEVNQITGANIAPSAINGDKIQNGTVGSLDLAEGAVTLPKLADAENGVPGDIIQWDGFNWVLVNENILGITEVDGIVGNEVVGPTDGTLVLNGGGSGTDPYTLDVADDGITNNELADNSVNSIKIQDGQVASADLANNAVTTVKIANANVTNVKLADNSVNTVKLADDAVTSGKILDANVTLNKLANGTIAGQLMQWDGTNWVLVDETSLNITETDGIIGNEVTNTTDGTLTRSGAGTDVDPFTLGVSTAGITDNELADDAVTLPKLANGTTAGQLIQWDGTDWVLVDETALNITETDGVVGNEVTNTTDGTLTRSGAGTDVDPFTLGVTTGGITDNELADDAVTLPKLANGTTAGQLMQWDGTNWVLVDETSLNITETDGIIGNEVTNTTDGTLTRSGAGTDVDPFTLGVTTAGITDNELADDAVTLPKLANGTTAGQLMQWDGTDWVLVDQTSLTISESDGIIGNEVTNTTDGTLTRSGAGTDVDPFTLGVTTGGITDNELADDAVTLPKLANGTTAGQLMQWDGTNWILVDETALNITETDGVVGNEVTNTTDGTLTRSGAGTDVDPFTLGVSTAGITDNELADDAVTLPKLANGTTAGQLMQWDGTDWVLVDDSALDVVDEIASANQIAAGIGTAGAYTIPDPTVSSTSIIQLTVQENTPGNPIMIQLVSQGAGSFSVQVYEFIASTPTATNANWQYIVINP